MLFILTRKFLSLKSMKNVLILDTGKEWGGGTICILELLKRIDKAKYHFTALFYNNYEKGDTSDIKTEIEKLGIEFLLIEKDKQALTGKILKELLRALFFYSKQLRDYAIFLVDYNTRIKSKTRRISKILKDLKIDLLYMNNQPSSNLEGIIASKIANIPSLQHSRIETTLNRFEVKAVNQYLHKMICVSEGLKHQFIKQGVDPQKTMVVYDGIDPETIPQTPPHSIREMYGVAKNDILIGTVGSLIRRKRINDLIEATYLVVEKSKHCVKCIIVGEGPEKEYLLKQVERKRLTGKVLFTGFQTDAVSYINAMDIFVLTSEKEGFSRVVLEAMLMGKPVVASDITGPSELVCNGETGYLVEARKPSLFAKKIIELIKNQNLRKMMGEKAVKRATKNFSIEMYVKGVETCFEKILNS